MSENERPVQAETIPEEAALAGAGEVGLAPATVLLGAEADPRATGGALGHARQVPAAGDFLSRWRCHHQHRTQRAAHIPGLRVHALHILHDKHHRGRAVLSQLKGN